MSKLDAYYQFYDTVLGNLNEEHKKVLATLEDDIIAEEILPTISESVAPVLSTMRRALTLVVDYDPQGGITVKTTRGEVVVKEQTAKKYQLSGTNKVVKVAEAEKSPITSKATRHVENPTKGLRVTFPDGTVLCHKTAIDTFIATLRKIGLERIAQVGITNTGYNIVSREKRSTATGTVWQHEVDGWYIYSNTNNATKVKYLRTISDYYHLGLIIEEGKSV